MQSARGQIETLLADAVTVHCGLIEPANLTHSVDLITAGKETKQWSLLMKTVVFELWLRTRAGNVMPLNSAGHRDEFMPSFHRADKIRVGRAAI